MHCASYEWRINSPQAVRVSRIVTSPGTSTSLKRWIAEKACCFAPGADYEARQKMPRRHSPATIANLPRIEAAAFTRQTMKAAKNRTRHLRADRRMQGPGRNKAMALAAYARQANEMSCCHTARHPIAGDAPAGELLCKWKRRRRRTNTLGRTSRSWAHRRAEEAGLSRDGQRKTAQDWPLRTKPI